jgi:acetate kinase
VRLLVVNAGSSTVKLSLLGDGDETFAAHELDAPRAVVDQAQLRRALGADLQGAEAVGHRIVHGGEQFHSAVLLDADVRAALAQLTDLAPLHQPKSLAALDAVGEALPNLPAVACFDTAFHATLPAGARTYALPASWRRRWGLRRYGFHGLSHAWVARRAPELLHRDPSELRIVSCHLGAGASLCAIAGGRSVATTMGFTPLEGLVMATRSGSVDPGLLLWLLPRTGLTPQAFNDALEHQSGLLGLAHTSDMREVIAGALAGEADPALALEVYLHRLRAGIGEMTAGLGGLDVLVFTGGVGQRAADIRSGAAQGLEFLGVALDPAANASVCGEGEITAAGAPVAALVVEAREDLEIARQTRAVLQS